MDDPQMPLSYGKNAYQPMYHEYVKDKDDEREQDLDQSDMPFQMATRDQRRSYFCEQFHNRFRNEIQKNTEIMVDRLNQLEVNRNENDYRQKMGFEKQKFIVARKKTMQPGKIRRNPPNSKSPRNIQNHSPNFQSLLSQG